MDRLAYRRLPRGIATLVLPTGVVAVNFAMSLVSPYGTWGDIAYSQVVNLPLLQVLSVVGLHGVTFLIYWSAAVVADVLERGFSWRIVLYPATVLVVVLVLGGLRVGLSNDSVPTVRTASVVVDQGDLYGAVDRLDFDLTNPSATPPEVAQILERHHEELFTLTEREASAGAALVAWSEANAIVRQPEEAGLVARAAEIAERHGTYIVMGVAVYRPGDTLATNKLVTVGPDGEVTAEYVKAKILPGDENVRGDGEVVMLDTPFGRVAQFICFDLDFPRFAREASRAGADIMVVPSNDWREIASYHSWMAASRGVENGTSIVRPARNGRSLATDPYGRVLSTADQLTTSPHVMVSNVPTSGVTTAYGTFGDAFAWVCTLAFIILTAVTIMQRRNTPTTLRSATHETDNTRS